MEEMASNIELVAYCGLYCGACGAYRKKRCPGCHENRKASWCAVRTCCMTSGYSSCAECREFDTPQECRKYNNFISKLFGFVFRSDRAACITQIKKIGIQGHADTMAKEKKQTIKKGSIR